LNTAFWLCWERFLDSIYALLADLVREGRAVSLATVVGTPAGPDSPPIGAKLLIPGGSPPVGSIHPEVDERLAADARRLLAQERSEIVAHETTAGTIEVFIESFPPPQQLVIVGAVHVAIPLARLAKLLGYRLVVVDPRGVFANVERFPEADRLLVEWPEEAFPKLDLNASTSVAVLTHDPKIDLLAIKIALESEARYVGAIGSRSTTEQRIKDLAEMGVPQEQIDRLHSPIGLNIGSRTPAEIALSIMAQVVAARRMATG
jgi:xanthine dehydrogenase accessory factor